MKKWFHSLSDQKAKAYISRRIDKIKFDNNLGDYKFIDNNLYELRIFISTGIRLYFSMQNNILIILIYGGDKSTQNRDRQKAKEISDKSYI